MLIETLTPDFVHRDARGTLTQLVREGYRQINVVFSSAGSFRGGHRHRDNTELFYIVSGRVRVTAALGDEREEREFAAGDMFLIPPGVSHDFQYPEDTTLIGMYDRGVETPDGNGRYVVTDVWED